MVVILLDGSQPLTPDDRALLDETSDVPRVIAVNKSDLPDAWPSQNIQASALKLSVRTGDGLAELREALLAAVGGGDDTSS